MAVAFLGGLSTGVTSMYGTGLDFPSVFPGFSRVQASLWLWPEPAYAYPSEGPRLVATTGDEIPPAVEGEVG